MAVFSCVMSSVSFGVACCTSVVVVLGMICGCGSVVVYCVGFVCKCVYVVPGVCASGLARLGRCLGLGWEGVIGCGSFGEDGGDAWWVLV